MINAPNLPEGYRRIAWNGISFGVPENWEIAVFRFLRRRASRIEMEDEYSVRMEAEWISRGKGKLDVETVLARYEKAAKPLTVKAEECTEVSGLATGWHATNFRFKETGDEKKQGRLEVIEHGLVSAFYCCPEASLFCFFLLHFMPEDSQDPEAIIRNITNTFANHTEDPNIPWQLFDISFSLPKEFRLDQANFDIGSKMMRFKWSGRRFHLWHFSCADMFLKAETTPDHWTTGYLNGYGNFRGIRFRLDGNGGISWRRRKPHIFGHRGEIARLCFRYHIGYRHDKKRNMLIVWVYNYRKSSDLNMLPKEFRTKT